MPPLAHPNNIKTPNAPKIGHAVEIVDNKIRSLLGRHNQSVFSALSTVNDPEKNYECLNALTRVLIADMQDWIRGTLSGFTSEEYNHVVGVAVSKLKITTESEIDDIGTEPDDDPTVQLRVGRKV